MATTITFSLNGDGRKKAVLEGRDITRCVLDVPQDHPLWKDVVELGHVKNDGTIELRAAPPGVYTEFDHWPTIEESIEAEKQRRAKALALAEEQKARERERAEERARKLSELSAAVVANPSAYLSNNLEYFYCSLFPGTTRVTALSREAQEAYRRAWHEKSEAKEAAEAKEKAEAERADAEYQAALDTAVRELGTPNQIGRLNDGFLPRKEAESIVRDHLFSALNELPRYERLTGFDVGHEDGCYSESCEFSSDDADTLTAEQYEALRAVKAAAPEGFVVTPRIHKAVCKVCENETSRASAKVAITWNGRTLTREYALGE